MANRTPTILCIDDDPEVSRVLELQLSRFDVRFVRAFHGMHGMAEALEKKPDLIVLDLGMPRGDGEMVLECVRRNLTAMTIPIIILTGRRNPILKHRLLSQGADAFLQKPVAFQRLLNEFRRFVKVRPRPCQRADRAVTQGVNHAT